MFFPTDPSHVGEKLFYSKSNDVKGKKHGCFLGCELANGHEGFFVFVCVTIFKFHNVSLVDMSVLSYVRQRYLDWVNDEKYMILARYSYLTNKHRHFAVLLSKRGNLIYKRRILSRFSKLSVPLSKITFFNEFTNDKVVHTPSLWLTLTYDTKICDLETAWLRIAKQFNRFRSNIIRRYGKASILRVFESTKKGYPHIHALIVFHDFVFSATKQFSPKRKRWIWVTKEKNKIQEYWHSHIDVRPVSDMKGSLLYLKKYLTKTIDKEEKSNNVINTLALTWYYKKRSFAVSRDLIRYLHNSNIKTKQLLQHDLLGGCVEQTTIIFVGIVPKSALLLKKTKSYIRLSDKQIKSVYEWLDHKV